MDLDTQDGYCAPHDLGQSNRPEMKARLTHQYDGYSPMLRAPTSNVSYTVLRKVERVRNNMRNRFRIESSFNLRDSGIVQGWCSAV